MAVVFGLIVIVDEWSDRTLSPGAETDVIGTTSVIVWACTLLGSYGIGPVAVLRDILRR